MWRWTVLLLALAAVAVFSCGTRDAFTAYAPGRAGYTSSAVARDPCPFAADDGVQLLNRSGVDTGAMCASTAGGLRVSSAYYADASSLAVSSYCLEETANGPRVAEVAAGAGAVVTPLNAPTLASLLQAAQAAAPKGTLHASMLLVSQSPSYGGAFLTSTRAAGFDHAAVEAGQDPSGVALAGLLLTVPNVTAMPALNAALQTAFRASSELCNLRCVDAPTKRCGCASGPGATCVSTNVKTYANFNSPANASTYWVAYEGGF